MMFKPNLDMAGRLIRLTLAIILLLLAYWYGSWLLLIASAFTFFEVLRGWCVVYQLLGIDHCPIDKR